MQAGIDVFEYAVEVVYVALVTDTMGLVSLICSGLAAISTEISATRGESWNISHVKLLISLTFCT